MNLPESMTLTHPDARNLISGLDPDVVRRMRNWANWDSGKGVSAGRGCSGFMLDYGTGYQHSHRESVMPILVLEAEQTEKALLSIEDVYGSAVALFWKGGEEMSFREMGAQLGCNHETVKARIIRGHELLTAEFYRIQEARRLLVEKQDAAQAGVGGVA